MQFMDHDKINQVKELRKRQKVSNNGPKQVRGSWQHFMSTMNERMLNKIRKRNTKTNACKDWKKKERVGGI